MTIKPGDMTTALTQAIAVFPSGSSYLNLATSQYAQAKTGLGVFTGLTVNSAGTSSAAALYDGTSSVVTITIATPGVISWDDHPFVAGDAVKFTTTGALPTGLTAGTTYYVSTAGLAADHFRVADTQAHALAGTNTVNTSGTQSGTQTAWDVTRPMGTFTTTAQVSIPALANGLQFGEGLIVIASDASAAANLTVGFV